MNCVSENNFYVTVNDVGECAMGSGEKIELRRAGLFGIKNEEIFDDLTRRNLSLQLQIQLRVFKTSCHPHK